MSYGLRLSLIFTITCWLVVIGAALAVLFGEPAAVNLVVGVLPAGIVGSVATIIESRSEREHKAAEPADDGDVPRVG